jgi:hypothetical protein
MAGLIDDAEYERLMMFGGDEDDLPVRVAPLLYFNVPFRATKRKNRKF